MIVDKTPICLLVQDRSHHLLVLQPGDEIARYGLKEVVVYSTENAGDAAEIFCGTAVVPRGLT